MSEPLVTIITVTYNSEKYVRDAIESVLAQSYKNIQYIIADDCSSDNTWNIISEYKDNRIECYRNEKNLNEYPNRNKAIEKAKGQYLVFIDGDDVIYAHGLEYMVKMMQTFPACAYATCAPYRNDIIYPIVIDSLDFLKSHFFGKTFVSTSLSKILFRTNILKSISGFSTKYISGDDHCTLTLATKYKVLITSHDMAWWRETPGQQSKKINVLTRLKENWYQTNEILNYEHCPLSEKQKKFIIHHQIHYGYKQALKYFLMLNFKLSFKILNLFGFKLAYFSPPSKENISLDVFKNYSAFNPMKLQDSDNPFSINYTNKY